MAGAQREGGDGRVDNLRPGLNAGEVRHAGQAGGVVAVELDGQVHPRLDGLDELGAVHGVQQARHVLDGDGVRPHLLHLLGHVGEGVQRVDGRQRVAHAELKVRAFLLHLVRGNLHVAKVVQRVEHADDVDAVAHSLLHELAYGVVRVVAVAEEVLPAKEHLELGVLDAGANEA